MLAIGTCVINLGTIPAVVVGYHTHSNGTQSPVLRFVKPGTWKPVRKSNTSDWLGNPEKIEVVPQ